ncbi:zf-HC2 domain-containing protein [Streptomyces sp. AM 3-1-1]|uniref:zf-HC2 domain-containing protein n=1 Tax=Streptomyces sp. AM 3-1-1 TaxID=3028711 RepID=UPI0023B9CEC2|nr:zf-HC2 domain-containing protein [Streptomyces sp. AM 3-1-1]WEH29668.1 zf-HC2 domain-containing protein [Streptomyces sp. AM 3-1-1]
MSGSRPPAARRCLSEQHLGDRLAAFVDGELDHDARERVLSHLATCPRCKADADEQRRLKTAFAQAAAPALPPALLERLQGLPGGPHHGHDLGHGQGPGGFAPFASGRGPGFGIPPRPAGSPGAAGRLGSPAGRAAVAALTRPALAPVLSPVAPFPVHSPPQSESARTSSRGRRFAYAAAGAVSLAALALGGVSSGAPTGDVPEARGSSVTPQRGPSTAGQPTEAARRRAPGILGSRSGGSGTRSGPARPLLLSAPLLPGTPVLPVAAPYSAFALSPAGGGLPSPLLARTAEKNPLPQPSPQRPAADD